MAAKSVQTILLEIGLGEYASTFTNYGVEHIQDFSEFDDDELQSEFNLNEVQIKKLRIATQAADSDDTVEQIHLQQSLTDSKLVGAWGLSEIPGGSTLTTNNHLKLILERENLDGFHDAFWNMGITDVETVRDNDLFHDDDVLKQMGMTTSEIDRFRKSIKEQNKLQIKSHNKSISPTKSNDNFIHLKRQQQQHNDSIRKQQMLQLQQYERGAESFDTMTASLPDVQPESSNQGDSKKSSGLLTRNIFGRRSGSVGRPDMTVSSKNEKLCSPAGDLMMPPPPPPPLPSSTSNSSSTNKVFYQDVPTDTSKLRPTPQHQHFDPQKPSPQVLASSESEKKNIASKRFRLETSVIDCKEYPGFAKDLAALPPSEHSKVRDALEEAFVGLPSNTVERINHSEFAEVSSPPPGRPSSWLKEIGVHLPQMSSLSTSCIDESALAMHRLVENIFVDLHACDRMRHQNISFDDRRLQGFESRLLTALVTFVAKPLKVVAESSYLISRKRVTELRCEAGAQRRSLMDLHATISENRQAGDLEAALSNQSRLQVAYQTCITLVKNGRSAAAALSHATMESASKLAELGVNLESDQHKTRNGAENVCDDDDDTEGKYLSFDNASKGGSGTKDSSGMIASPSDLTPISAYLSDSLRFLRRFRRRSITVFDDLRKNMSDRQSLCENEVVELKGRQDALVAKLDRLKAGIYTEIDNQVSVGHPSDGLWRTRLEAEERKRIEEARKSAESTKAAEIDALDAGWAAIVAGLEAGDRLECTEIIAANAQQALQKLDQTMAAMHTRRHTLVATVNNAESLRTAILNGRKNSINIATIVLKCVENRLSYLQNTATAYKTAQEMFQIVQRHSLNFCKTFASRLRTIARGAALVEEVCLGENIDLASSLLVHYSTIVNRKERDVETLAGRVMLHARDRRDAIERDSMDDVRRADRDKEETLRSQRLARSALAAAKERQSEAAADLATALITLRQLSQIASENPNTLQVALHEKLFSAAAHAVSLARTFDHADLRDAENVVSRIPRQFERAFATEKLGDKFAPLLNETTSGMEARLNFFEETVPYAKDGLGSLITVEAVNQLFSIEEESSVTNHVSSSDGILGTRTTSRADDPTTVTNATPHHTTVDVLVPAAAVVGDKVQASVVQGDMKFNFDVQIPTNAIPGVTILKVPLPPLESKDSAQLKQVSNDDMSRQVKTFANRIKTYSIDTDEDEFLTSKGSL